MNVSTMRRVDRWLGQALCIALTGVRAVADRLRGPAGPIERIIFIKLAEQGATVLAVSAIRRAIELVGRENVYFLVFKPNRFILDVMDLIPAGNVLTIDDRSLLASLRDSLGAVRRMRALELDTAIDMEFFARSSAIFAYLSGARRRVGFHAYGGEGPSRGDLMTHRLRFNPHLHTSQTFRLLVDALDVDPSVLPAMPIMPGEDVEPPPFEPPDDEVERVRRLVRDAAGAEVVQRLVLLNANCSDLIPLRAWPRDRYVTLARRLLEAQPHLHVAFTGDPTEASSAAGLVREVGHDRCFSLAGRTTLREFLIVCGLADLLITNDSGPAHFATLTPASVITLFGPEHPNLFAARSPRNHVLFAGLPCSPCVSALNNRASRCRDKLCLQAIGVERVYELASHLLAARDDAPATARTASRTAAAIRSIALPESSGKAGR